MWQLPQNIIGLIIYNYYSGPKVRIDSNAKAKISKAMPGGITLGKYIVVKREEIIKHEFGHTRQSMLLGPLYLLVIGLPSIIHAARHSKYCKNKDYYHFWTEKWANKLSDKYYKED